MCLGNTEANCTAIARWKVGWNVKAEWASDKDCQESREKHTRPKHKTMIITVHGIVKVSSHKILNKVTILLQWSIGSIESEDSAGTWRVAGFGGSVGNRRYLNLQVSRFFGFESDNQILDVNSQHWLIDLLSKTTCSPRNIETMKKH